MNKVFIRIDNRLIHGQVVNAWIPYLKASKIVVISDNLDALQMQLFRLAVPTIIKLEMYSVNDFIKYNNANNLINCNTLIVLPNLTEAEKLYKKGYIFNKVNIGNLHYCKGKKKVTDSVFINPDDLKIFTDFKLKGIEIEIRAIPTDEASRI